VQLIEAPSVIKAAGTPAKLIAEYVGRLNTGGSALSIAHMISPQGWREPGQTPEFDEYTVLLRGVLCVETRTRGMEVRAGQAILAPKGEWVRYSTPREGGAEYVAICLPAFSPEMVHRDE
jgi:mannose-6-phosphate isomerase-like protein (cupin superfamily)